jgi:hypothetical protein
LIFSVLSPLIKSIFEARPISMTFKRKFYAIFAILIAGSAHAENRVFNFISPSFGGNPNNGAFLFGVAQAQVTATDRNPVVGGIGSGGGSTVGNGGDIGGPTIIIPITTNSGGVPVVPATTPVTATEATATQVTQ